MDSNALARPSSIQSDNYKFLITPHRCSDGSVCEVFVLDAYFDESPTAFVQFCLTRRPSQSRTCQG